MTISRHPPTTPAQGVEPPPGVGASAVSSRSTLSSLLHLAPAVSLLATCEVAHETFLADIALIALPVLDEQETPCAILDRYPFVEFFSRSYRGYIRGFQVWSRVSGVRQDVSIHFAIRSKGHGIQSHE